MTDQRGNRRVLQGTVVSDKAPKTITVRVERYFKHPRYKKYIRRSKNYMVHDEANECRAGDVVTIVESRPMSAHKRWRVSGIVKRTSM